MNKEPPSPGRFRCIESLLIGEGVQMEQPPGGHRRRWARVGTLTVGAAAVALLLGQFLLSARPADSASPVQQLDSSNVGGLAQMWTVPAGYQEMYQPPSLVDGMLLFLKAIQTLSRQ